MICTGMTLAADVYVTRHVRLEDMSMRWRRTRCIEGDVFHIAATYRDIDVPRHALTTSGIDRHAKHRNTPSEFSSADENSIMENSLLPC